MLFLLEFTKYLKIPTFTIFDFIDILITAFIIYRILLLIKGTRAAQMAFGILFIVVFFYISKEFHLKIIQWFLSNFMTYVVFAIIVLYQNEIRKILANIGTRGFIDPLTSSGSMSKIDEIVLAATTLSSKKIGALMVIERKIGLKSFMENGIILDAKLSYDLLVTIFYPETPLHDGAVIIQGDKIAAAACFLPLTLDPYLSKEFGTRHRAAIGITEDTDAIAVVVSEETGAISIVIDGHMERKLDGERLKEVLSKELSHGENRGKFRINLFKKGS